MTAITAANGGAAVEPAPPHGLLYDEPALSPCNGCGTASPPRLRLQDVAEAGVPTVALDCSASQLPALEGLPLANEGYELQARHALS